MLSERVKILADSKTLVMANKARTLRSKGTKVYDFTIGEPDYPTPDHIKAAGKTAIDNNITKYSANEGALKLRQAIKNYMNNEFDLAYEPDEIIISTGAKQSIFNAVFSLINPGDEVIIQAPYYVSYPEIVSLAQGKAVYIYSKERNGYKITSEDLRKAITPKTKLFILNNPCNPTGAAYTESELLELADVLKDKNIYILSDEIYYKLVYDGLKFKSFAALNDVIKERTIIINGVSKTYSMTGWRIGFGCGNKEIIRAMNKIQSHSTSGACSVAQEAAAEAYIGKQDEVYLMVDEFKKRRDYLYSALSSIEGVSLNKGQGAFYLFPDISYYYNFQYNGNRISNSNDFAEFLLDKEHVAVVPGGASGYENCIRLSYATSMENIKEGAEKIKEALNYLRESQ